ncbi:MAG: hypothetical protein ABIR18_10225 [Chitinophagaceae bacterium]
MRKIIQQPLLIFFAVIQLTLESCKEKNSGPSSETLSAIDLKRGEVVLCGPPDQQFGSVEFESSCSDKVKKDFNLAIALLHSFEYDEAEKVFAKVIDAEPGCAMAYWGVAMANYHMLWPTVPSPAELEKGAKAVAVAQSITDKSKRESDYINAIASFYQDWDKTDHRTRNLSLNKAMEKVYTDYPDDKEAAIFYALTLDASADPADKTFANQKKAGAILTSLYPNQSNHPGVVHYIIHTYDSPELASLGLEAARKYASIAPSSAHAQHMPSHIFTRLGLWDENIKSNLVSASSAKCYGENLKLKGHWDEELHAMDYLVYAYLQKGDNKLAKDQWDYLNTINEISPPGFKVAYAFAAIPSRYLLENRMWKEAATLEVRTANIPWNKFPWQMSIAHLARALGNVHIGKIDSARAELAKLNSMHKTLVDMKDSYKANQVMIQVKTAEAWILFKEGKNDEALKMMNAAADMEDKTEKSPVTPGEVIPARELVGDMLMQMNKPAEALVSYEADLVKHVNRFNGLYGAGLAAEKSNNPGKANTYYRKLAGIASSVDSNRPELKAAKAFLKNEKQLIVVKR